MSRIDLFPITTRTTLKAGKSHLTIAGLSLADLADQYGTPLYIYDETTLADAVETYRSALRTYYPGEAGLTYAGKAFLCIAMAKWAVRQGLRLDCSGVGELFMAACADAPKGQVVVHGVNKSYADLEAGLEQGGVIVVDNFDEIQRLAKLARDLPRGAALQSNATVKNTVAVKNTTAGEGTATEESSTALEFPKLWLRVRPGLAVKTHAYRQTGQEESKFGFSPEEARQAVRMCLEQGLPVEGLHFHLGSHFHDPSPLEGAIDTVLKLAANLRDETGWVPRVLSPGGGWGVAYSEEDLPQPSIEAYVAFLAGKLTAGCQKLGLPLPYLQLEPGRSLAARAGVAVYRVGAVKHTARRRWLLLDGGMADNPRPALYKARYSALPVVDAERPYRGRAWLAGPYCESGDILIKNLPMADIQVGELIAVPVSGAYQLSMGSNYNGARKPAVIWLDEAGAHLILRRETLEDLINRDEAACI